MTEVEQAAANIAGGSRDPFDYVLVGWERAQSGDQAAAFSLLEKAIRIAPGDPVALTTIAAVYREDGQLRNAVFHCDAAIRACPTYAPAWLERGFILSTGGSFDLATESYSQAARLDPGSDSAWAGLAMLGARQGNHQIVRDNAAKALSLNPKNLIAAASLAAINLNAGAYYSVVEQLDPLLAIGGRASSERANALNILGDAHDRLGQTANAFEAYHRCKLEFAAAHVRRFPPGRETHRQFIDRIAAHLRNYQTDNWAIPEISPIDGEAAGHIFLLGYPRSGTTLVENMLASLPDVLALEERPTLREADGAFLSDDAGFEALTSLNLDEADRYRSAYWAKVKAAGLDVTGKTFVDMDPLKGIRLPIIARLFPRARVVIMRRDPRDIIWSCFHTNFALTSTSYEFSSLERTAHHYHSLMTLTELSLRKLPITYHEVHYSSLVQNFDETTNALCRFLDLSWSAKLLDFGQTAARRGVTTASAAQVVKPLYDGTGQWQRYSEYLQDVMPILQPWIDKFGADN